MSCFSSLLDSCPEYNTLLRSVKRGSVPLGVLGLAIAPKAYLIHSLCCDTERRALVVVPEEAAAVKLCDDLNTLGTNAVMFPARDFNFHTTESSSREFEHKRLSALGRILRGEYDVAVCSAEAAVQKTLPAEELKRRSLRIKTGGEISTDNILTALIQAGYSRSDMVEGPAQFSIRGGIVDFFPPDRDNPVRAEFFGDEVDSLAEFDTVSQRRGDILGEVLITPASEVLFDSLEEFAAKIETLMLSLRGKYAADAKQLLKKDIELLRADVRIGSTDKYLPLAWGTAATIFDYCPDDMLIISDSAAVKERAISSVNLLNQEIKELFEDGTLCKGLDSYTITFDRMVFLYEKLGAMFFDNFARGSFDVAIKDLVTFTVNQLSSWDGSYKLLLEDITPNLQRDYTVIIFAGTEKAASGLMDELCEDELPCIYCKAGAALHRGYINVLQGSMSSGMDFPGEKLLFVSYGRFAKSSRKSVTRLKKSANGFNSLDELQRGDYVVHASHGIGIFDGIEKVEMDGITKDYIKLQYAKGDVLYVPVTKLDLVSKYIGPHEEDGSRTVKINRLGSPEWQKTKSRVKGAVKDMAGELLNLYAARQSTPGFAFSPDIDMQNDFERRFEFDETDDQLRCIAEIKQDMEKPHPMDRLLCGDVGFGKTEVALRAAFKCIADGKQCAILVPTTILAFQHYRTILRRFEGFPITAEMLSRFRNARQQAKIIKDLRAGSVDIVTGTHRLISKDVQFKDLGLVIVDEEQRFGVAQKEKLKEAFPSVDVLTLSATPIPRTLNLAMSGIRDMSVIEEAPLDRYPVQTYVIEHDMGILEQAIAKELRRGGQVYYLHNRVDDISKTAAMIKEHFPDASIAIAHGKMDEEELSEIWRRLVEGEIDILVCTTIIETGVDVPNVNTLIIENADRMGLSQLHQLRGRVGRATRRASAYFTFARDKEISEIAERRLSAIREYTEFGSGFKIAMRDLEIRGAGNMLGSQQHGHMEAVGYDMYIKLLAEAIAEKKSGTSEPVEEKECQVDVQINAHIPDNYITSYPQRLAIYRRIADIRTEDDASDVTDELIDRYGEPPESVTGLINVSLMRNTFAQLGITEITQNGDKLLLYTAGIDKEMLSKFAKNLRGRAMASASNRPYYSVKLLPRQNPSDCMREIIEAIK